jgi:DNA (cytosine-5)-methyltransferase 1
MAAYYNEIDKGASEWLRELIKGGHIAPGDVDERDIRDVAPADLLGYAQCHFFAGIGGWSLALRNAGWADDTPVWTGSCPCQPFSAAGRRGGLADERHLWPHWHHLVDVCRPPVVFGEQVASKDGLGWLDLVSADLEASGYAVAAADLCVAGVGGPHIRQRLWFVGMGHPGWAAGERNPRSLPAAQEREHGARIEVDGHYPERPEHAGASVPHRTADASVARSLSGSHGGIHRAEEGSGSRNGEPERLGSTCGLADLHGDRRIEAGRSQPEAGCNGSFGDRAIGGLGNGISAGLEGFGGHGDGSREPGRIVSGAPRSASEASPVGEGRPGPTNGFWRDADWLFCRDGKWRPVEARPQPLADGLPPSLGRVRDPRATRTEEAVTAHAKTTQARPEEVLRNLCEALSAEAEHERQAGGYGDVSSPALLLSFVCQLAAQGWGLAQDLPLSRPQEPSGGMRMLWDAQAASGTSRQRGLGGQQSEQFADLVHLLSPLLARDAQEAWGEAFLAYAEIGFPLGKGSPARVARLRGYGNAISPVPAEAFIRAAQEAMSAL